MRKNGDRYFDGYQRRQETDETGKVHSRLVYTAEYYGYENPEQQKRVKAWSAGLTALMLLAYFYAQLHPAIGGMVRIMAVPGLLVLIPMMFQLIGLVNLLLAKQQWELHTLYAGYRRLRRSSIGTMILLGIWAIMELIFICMHLNLLRTELLYFICALVSTCAQTALTVFLEKHQPVVVATPEMR